MRSKNNRPSSSRALVEYVAKNGSRLRSSEIVCLPSQLENNTASFRSIENSNLPRRQRRGIGPEFVSFDHCNAERIRRNVVEPPGFGKVDLAIATFGPTRDEAMTAEGKCEILNNCPLFMGRNTLEPLPQRCTWTDDALRKVQVVVLPTLKLKARVRNQLENLWNGISAILCMEKRIKKTSIGFQIGRV